MYHNIVLPIKPDHLSIKAFLHAFGLAAETGGKITVVYASSKIMDDDEEMMLRISLDKFHESEDEEIHAVGKSVHQMLDSDEFAKYRDKIPCDIQVIPERDSAHKAVVGFAKKIEADLIVLSIRHRSPTLDLILGNFKEWVIHHAEIPVLVIHES